MSIKHRKSQAVWMFRHLSHEKPVMSGIICFADDQIEQIPQTIVSFVLKDQISDQIVSMKTVSIQKWGQEAHKF